MKEFQPVTQVDKIQQIIRVIHEYIVEGNLEQGTELPSERELSEKLEVSRFSLREALRVAQSQGLIEITRGRRPRVVKTSAAAAAAIIALSLRRSNNTFKDLIEARMVLETHIAKVAALKATEDDISALRETIRNIEAKSDELETCLEQDLAFHNILVRATGNVVFEIMLAPLSELLRDLRKESFRKGTSHALLGHKQILAAVEQRNGDGASAAMRLHLELTEQDLS